jgi:CheY-like chemotaxis protein
MCHALVIEDDYLVADYIAALAEFSGATSTAIASTQEEALKSAKAKRPTVILCDVRLDEGCGPSAIGEILACLGPIPVLYITGIPEECPTSHRAHSVLPKPFSRDAFVSAFRKHAGIG